MRPRGCRFHGYQMYPSVCGAPVATAAIPCPYTTIGSRSSSPAWNNPDAANPPCSPRAIRRNTCGTSSTAVLFVGEHPFSARTQRQSPLRARLPSADAVTRRPNPHWVARRLALSRVRRLLSRSGSILVLIFPARYEINAQSKSFITQNTKGTTTDTKATVLCRGRFQKDRLYMEHYFVILSQLIRARSGPAFLRARHRASSCGDRAGPRVHHATKISASWRHASLAACDLSSR